MAAPPPPAPAPAPAAQQIEETHYDENHGVLWHTPYEIALGDHVQQCFGEAVQCVVFHAMFQGLHVYCYHPQPPARPFWTLMTMGLSGFKMRVPDHIEDAEDYERCELMCYMPPEWVPPAMLPGGPEPANEHNWPLLMIKRLANYVVIQDVWISQWHGIPNFVSNPPGGPILPNSALTGTLLAPPVVEHPDFAPFVDAVSGTKVQFWVVLPMTQDEWDLKRAHNVEALFPYLESGKISTVCQIYRRSALLAGGDDDNNSNNNNNNNNNEKVDDDDDDNDDDDGDNENTNEDDDDDDGDEEDDQ